MAILVALGCTLAGIPGGLAARADETPSANVAAARRHYDKARAFYEQGAYRDAIGELDAAHTLDPNAKDLVFNLGVVHEKLGDIDDALTWFRLYSTMNLTPQESDRAEAYLRRLEGVKKQREQENPRRAAVAPSTEGAVVPAAAGASAAPAEASPSAARGPRRSPSRFDAPTVTAGGIAAVGLIVGATLGVKALVDKPGSDFVTGRDGSYDDLTRQVDQAHGEAVAADVAFGVAAAAGLAFAYLYWLRPHPHPSVGTTTVSAAPVLTQRGIALCLGGTL